MLRARTCSAASGVLRIDGVGRADLAGEAELVVRQIDGDDLARAGGDGAENRGQADTAEADHRGGLAELEIGGVDDGADAGEHGASEEGRFHQGKFGVDLDHGMPRNHGVIGETGDAEMMIDRHTVAMQAAFAGEQRAGAVGGSTWFAEGGAALGAGHAVAAARHEHHHHVVARLEVGHIGADFLHNARGFMAERHRHRARAVAVDDGEIGVAQASGGDADQHFGASRRIEIERLDRQRPGFRVGRFGAHLVEDGGADFHFCSPYAGSVTGRRARSSSTRTRVFSV